MPKHLSFIFQFKTKRQEIGKQAAKQPAIPAVEMGDAPPWQDAGPSKPRPELSSSSSTNTAVDCKCTFDIYSFSVKKVIVFNCSPSIL